MKPDNTGGSVTELDSGIYLIPGRKAGGCNVFVLRGKHKTILIDVGLPEDYGYLCAGLAEIGLTIDDIQMVILSHEHIDHIGCVPQLPGRIIVAAHERAANKFLLDDQFSMMSGAFNTRAAAFHVDLHLKDGTTIDIGGIRLRILYTPGHCSGAICLYEPDRAALFTADTVFSGGILGGIFASGNISDYINSLERLNELRLTAMYPGHGRMSSSPNSDIARAIEGSRLLMSDTQMLFDSIDIGNAFRSIKHGAVDYSRRAAERRQNIRVSGALPAIAHLPDADHPVETVNMSIDGILLDRLIPVAKMETVALTIDGVGDITCEVVDRSNGQTRLRLLQPSTGHQALKQWLQSNRPQNKTAAAPVPAKP